MRRLILYERLLKSEAPAAGKHWPAQYRVLSRANSAAIRVPCVRLSRMPITFLRRNVTFQQPQEALAEWRDYISRSGAGFRGPTTGAPLLHGRSTASPRRPGRLARGHASVLPLLLRTAQHLVVVFPNRGLQAGDVVR
jgi:hypothetical protein